VDEIRAIRGGVVGHTAAVLDAWDRHRRWSVAADVARRRIERRRLLVLVLLVVGAVAGAAGSQTGWSRPVTGSAAGVASLALAVAGLVQQRYLNATEVGRWPTARAASETLKAEVVRYLAGVAPYEDERTRDDVLNEQVDRVQERGSRAPSGLADFHLAQPDGEGLPDIDGFEAYRAGRARGQAEWHRRKIREHAGRAALLRHAEVAASLVGAVLAAVAAGTGTSGLAGWVGVAATVAATLAAHRAATNHERIAGSYAVTADVLDRFLARLPVSPDRATQARFVADVEARLAAQNDTWLELFPRT
jgi:uncharacterized protein DUF4231/conflict system pore-forming effector with SLATT domain